MKNLTKYELWRKAIIVLMEICMLSDCSNCKFDCYANKNPNYKKINKNILKKEREK